MDALPRLEITIPARDAVELRLHDPASRALPNPIRGGMGGMAGIAPAKNDPDAHGRALRDALLADPAVRGEFERALGLSTRAGRPQPLRITLDIAANERALHDLAWETLLEPGGELPLLSRSSVYFSRFLPSIEPVETGQGPQRALVFIASPERLADDKPPVWYEGVRLAKVEVEAERERATRALRGIATHVIASAHGRKGEASLKALLTALQAPGGPYQVLYLVCHGTIDDDGPQLWLDEQDDKPVAADLLVKGLLRGLEPWQRPRLVVLASCQSAGQPGPGVAIGSVDGRALAAIGPRLVQEAGIAAVVAMQGNIYMASVEAMMPAFFRELVATGQVERAMAVARGHLRVHGNPQVRGQWRVPVLFSRLADGQIWPARQPRPRTFYLAHAVRPEDAESAALAALRHMLEEMGFDVLESAGPPAAAEPWSQRLLDGLGTCDAAMLLINARSVGEAGSWVPVEAWILWWRTRLQAGFPLTAICLAEDCRPSLAQAPWALLAAADAPALAWATADELETRLRELLGALPEVQAAQRWRHSELQQRVIEHFSEMQLEGVLAEAAQRLQADLGLPVAPATPPVEWWARAALSRGPVALSRLNKDLGNLASERIRRAIRELLGPVQPAWVDIAVAARFSSLAAGPGSFYLRATGDPRAGKRARPDWIAQCYAARACGMALDLFVEKAASPCLLLVDPAASGDLPAILSQVTSALATRLSDAEPDLWAANSQVDPWDSWGAPTPALGQGGAAQDETIRACVTKRVEQGRPVLLLLRVIHAANPALLDAIRQRFGPVTFFFLDKEPAPPALGQEPSVVIDFVLKTADEAFATWDDLKDIA